MPVHHSSNACVEGTTQAQTATAHAAATAAAYLVFHDPPHQHCTVATNSAYVYAYIIFVLHPPFLALSCLFLSVYKRHKLLLLLLLQPMCLLLLAVLSSASVDCCDASCVDTCYSYTVHNAACVPVYYYLYVHILNHSLQQRYHRP
jgi:hypothetical protein